MKKFLKGFLLFSFLLTLVLTPIKTKALEHTFSKNTNFYKNTYCSSWRSRFLDKLYLVNFFHWMVKSIREHQAQDSFNSDIGTSFPSRVTWIF